MKGGVTLKRYEDYPLIVFSQKGEIFHYFVTNLLDNYTDYKITHKIIKLLSMLQKLPPSCCDVEKNIEISPCEDVKTVQIILNLPYKNKTSSWDCSNWD